MKIHYQMAVGKSRGKWTGEGLPSGRLAGAVLPFAGSQQGLPEPVHAEGTCAIRLTGAASASPTAIEGMFQGQDWKGQPIRGSFKLTP